MSRDLTANALTTLDGQGIKYAVLGFFDFVDGAQYLWAGPIGHSVTWDGQTWNGVGDLGKIDKITEPGDLRSARTVVSLRVTSDMLDDVETDGEANRGRSAELRIIFFDENDEPEDELVVPFEMGGTEADISLEDNEDGRVIVEEIKLTLLGRQDLLSRSFKRTLTHQDALEINSDDYGHEWASDPDLGTIGAGLSNEPRNPFSPRWR